MTAQYGKINCQTNRPFLARTVKCIINSLSTRNSTFATNFDKWMGKRKRIWLFLQNSNLDFYHILVSPHYTLIHWIRNIEFILNDFATRIALCLKYDQASPLLYRFESAAFNLCLSGPKFSTTTNIVDTMAISYKTNAAISEVDITYLTLIVLKQSFGTKNSRHFE